MNRSLKRLIARAYRFLKPPPGADVSPVWCEPGNETIVVLAPHMDDDVLGCGGSVARHVRAGARVTTVFVTDCRYVKAHAEAAPAERERLHLELLAQRKQEARRACELLGVEDLYFLDGDPRRLASDAALAQKLRMILESKRPSIVYLPLFLERHPDHRATSAVLLAAVAGTQLAFECRGYEVWTPLAPNLLVCIDDTMELKLEALRCHASQLAHTDFVHMIRGLNAYRSFAAPNRSIRHAEAFLGVPLAGYRELYRQFDSG